jgi:hypothetical protein
MACGIGDPWGKGPWRVINGHFRKTEKDDGSRRRILHLGDAGQGVNRELPHLGDAGQGVNRELPHLGDAEQRLGRYLHSLAARLERVRITCGSWERVVTPSVVRAGAGGDGARAVFLDPPYATSGDLYAHGSLTVGADVRTWCETAPKTWRVVLCGYDDEHNALLPKGWTVVEGKAGSGAGYSVDAKNGRRERLWLSPSCMHDQASFNWGAP